MSAPTYEEMEAKRQQMVASLNEVAAAMSRCVAIIGDYARLSPVTLAGGNAKPFLSSAGQAAVAVADGETKTRRKREKKIKDPNAPKRPPSAYILFQNEIREEIRRAHPGMAYKDVLTLIAEKWKELSPDQKKVYEDAYSDATNVYRLREETYNKGMGSVAPAAAPTTLQAVEDDTSSEESSSDDSDSSDGTPAVPAKKFVTPAHKAVTTTAPLMTPTTVDGKKEKKRKNKEDEAAVAATLNLSEKKKKKKSKDA